MPKRDKYFALGRYIGTASGWSSNELALALSDFIPIAGLNMPHGTITIDYVRGVIEQYDNNLNVVNRMDLVQTIGHLPLA